MKERKMMTKNQSKSQTESANVPKKVERASVWSNQQIEAAQNFWSKLSNDELIRSAGNKKELTDLVEKRYSIARESATNQVNSFFNKNQLG